MEKSTDRRFTRGGVPVLNRRMDSPSRIRHAVRGRGGSQAVGPRVPDHLPHDGAAPQIGAGGHHGGPHTVESPGVGDHTAHRPALGEDVHHLRLLDPQVLLALQGVLHELLVLPPVGLGPEGPDGGALAPVQQPVLDAGPVGRPAHLAPQGVQLPDQVALAGAPDGRVAGHVAHAVQVDGEAHRAQPHAGGGQGGLDARVARADHGNVKLSGVVGGHILGPLSSNSVAIVSRFARCGKGRGVV